MEDNKSNKNKIGIICSVTVIVISIICLVYKIVTKANFTTWIVMLCCGICLLCCNIGTKKDKQK